MSDTRTAPAETETIFRLTYRSHSRIPPAQEPRELAEILRVARARNAERGITGALMFYDRWFAQALEGPRAEVMALFDRIRADPRHEAVQVAAQGDVAGRVFSRWAMAHVGEHGEPDIAMTTTRDGLAEGAAWRSSPEQDLVLTTLRDMTRGYGRGA